MRSPTTLPADGPAVLIAALSGRALAQAARASGYVPLVADFFADEDMRAAAGAWELMPGSLVDGFDADLLIAALDRLASGRRPVALVYGSGLELKTDLLARLQRRYRLAGNCPNTVARLKNADAVAALCSSLKIPHPETRRQRPLRQTRWLSKLDGAAGGWHVLPAEDAPDDPRRYYQRRVAGRPVSVMFLADGKRSDTLGFSLQWSTPAPGRPFSYGGAVRPAKICREAELAMRSAVERIVAATGLVGLNSADFLVSRRAVRLLEVNPRPGATLDIYRDQEGRLFKAHMQACAGELPQMRLRFDTGAASTIIYADRAIAEFKGAAWPHWAHDRQNAGTSIPAHGPICSISATAAGAQAALRTLRQRTQTLCVLMKGLAP